MSFRRSAIRLQADKHGFVHTQGFQTIEDYCLYLIHLKAYETAAGKSRGKIVLDCGCNVGYGTKLISTYSREVIGVDVSKKAIQEASRQFGSQGITFQTVDGTHLPFKDQRFDLVISFQVIEHISDYTQYLGEIKRVLSDKGAAIFTTPNARIRLDPGMKPFYPFHIREFSADELKGLLNGYFSTVQVRGLFGSESLYAIEYNRVRESLEKVRRRPQWLNSLSLKIRAGVPDSLISFVRMTIRSLRRQKKPDEAVLQQYSTGDLFYRDDNPDEALDLMAICHK